VTRVLLCFLLASGCVPSLEEGYFGCAEMECPTGWVCHSDLRCYSRTNEPMERCGGDQDCSSGMCVRPDFGAPDSDGYCTTSCDEDAECTEAFGVDANCWEGRCLVRCATAEDCAAVGTECHIAHEMGEMPPMQASCYDITSSELDGSTPCTMGCESPGFCVLTTADTGAGVCTVWCNDDAQCPHGGRCLDVTTLGPPSCMHPCDPVIPMVCGRVLRCGRFAGDTQSYCMPEGWDGGTLPLPGRMPSMMTP
jgi:hypothetical protein